VLQRKETEYSSGWGLYDMQAPAEPLVNFDSYIDGDSLVQKVGGRLGAAGPLHWSVLLLLRCAALRSAPAHFSPPLPHAPPPHAHARPQDLVAWVTVGKHHKPTSEDLPVTTTPATEVGFYIRPANYFDESPATRLTRYHFAGYQSMGGSPELQTRTAVLTAEQCAQ
jgi:hypothetical protein